MDELDLLEDLFGHPGWKLIVDDAKRQIYQLQADALDRSVCKSWDDVNIARGKAEMLNEILVMPQIVETIKNQHKQEKAHLDASV